MDPLKFDRAKFYCSKIRENFGFAEGLNKVTDPNMHGMWNKAGYTALSRS